MNRKLVLLLTCFLVALSMAAQKRVTGKVTDTNGIPVASAVVRVTGTQVYTYTDNNGNFALTNVPNSAKELLVSYMGMKSKKVAVANNVEVVLEEDNQLEEAVVMGYGTAQKLGTVVGSVTRVGSEKIENKPVTTALDALQGKVAGVQILSSTGDVGSVSGVSTTVRGVGSLNGGNTPLYIVDGQPVDASVFYMMNQNDIESYNVLRDASATSIYGSRAANGVIYITTKKGHRGEKATVSVSQSIGWSQLARRMGNPMSSNELLDYQLLNGVISSAQYAQYKREGYATDWVKYFYKDSAPIYNTNFNVRGGTERTSYYTSASYLKRDGLTPYSRFKRITVRTNFETQALDWLQFGMNLGLNYDERNVDSNASQGSLYIWNNPVLGALMLQPYFNPYGEDGAKLIYFDPMGAYNLETLNYYRPRTIGEARITGTAFIQLTPIKGLTIKSQLGLDGMDQRDSQKFKPSAPYANNDNAGWAYESFGRSTDWTITNTAEYRFNIKEDHDITVLVGQEGIKSSGYSFGVQQLNFSDDRLLWLGLAPITEEAIPDISASSPSTVEYLSFFGRVNYGYQNKYFANFTIRNDRSSRFGSDNRSATFASGGVMWDMKAEKFLKPVWWLDDLKFKATYGSTGNSSGIGYYDHLGVTGTTQYAGKTGWGLARPANNKLGWETQYQANISFTARIFNRANIELGYYHRKTSDMLMSVPVPYTTGFSAQTMNIGEMVNQGIELQFDVDAVQNWHGLDVNIYGNLSYNANKITKLFYGLDKWVEDGTGLAYFVGKSVNYYMPVRAGVDPADGQLMWYVPDANGKLTDQTTKNFDEATLSVDTGKKYYAPTTGGFGLRATWKGLTLNADFSFVLGKWMQDNMEFFAMGGGGSSASGYNQDRALLNQWKKPGDITNVPKFGYTNQFDTSLLHNASFCRLKNLSLSYDLPGKWMDATGFIQNVRLLANARNLFTITKWKGADPETNTNVAQGAYPNTREYSIGVELTF
ncbi:MAG: SusC/RagA family TonB-linked outer membrane protein [Bacteroidales bacterium]|nr:SusC/RagA family TonB-linked outer membrane protein [Bacteroidales bacterium]